LKKNSKQKIDIKLNVNPLKIFIGDFNYNSQYRSLMVDILKPLIPIKNLEKYELDEIPLQIVEDGKVSDYFLLPYCWNYYIDTNTTVAAEIFIKSAQTIGKKTLIWVTGDYYIPLPRFDNLIGFYTSPYLSMIKKQKIIPLPVILPDPIKYLNIDKINTNQKSNKPVVGFCGQVDKNILTTILKTLKRIALKIRSALRLTQKIVGPIIPPTKFRKDVLNILERCNNIQTKFIRRKRYKGGSRNNKVLEKALKIEFYENILNTDYTVCIRGTGNFSARFYETLALGRIPIFINTDCILPFNDVIDWKKHVIWIEQNEISEINSKILAFHNGLTQDSFNKSFQKKNRQLWENYFSCPGFIRQIIACIHRELNH